MEEGGQVEVKFRGWEYQGSVLWLYYNSKTLLQYSLNQKSLKQGSSKGLTSKLRLQPDTKWAIVSQDTAEFHF